MKHIFIVNTKAGRVSCLDMVKKTIKTCQGIDAEIVTPNSAKESIAYIRNYLDNHHDEVRFYACGGDGTINKVATGIMGYDNASMSVLPYGSGNDYIKYYDNKESFNTIDRLLNGKEYLVDIMKVNDNYALNATHFGFDSVVAKKMNEIRRKKIIGGNNSYPIAIIYGFFNGMHNRCKVIADGEPLNDNDLLLCTVTNGKYVGGSYKCAPRSLNDDGLLEVCLVKPLPRLKLICMIGDYKKGLHLDKEKYEKHIIYRRAKTVELLSENEMTVSIDGEIYSDNHIIIENLKQKIRFVAPQ